MTRAYRSELHETPYAAPSRAVPLYVDIDLFRRLRERADQDGTTVNFLVIRILRDTLGPEPPLTPDDRFDLP